MNHNLNVSDLLEMIGRLLRSPDVKDREHAVSLLGKRTRGSLTDKGIESLSPDAKLVEYTPQYGVNPSCAYFRVNLPEDFNARIGAVPLRLMRERRADSPAIMQACAIPVSLRLGRHGPELYLDVPPDRAVFEPVSRATIILGPNDTGSLIPWTWFPGETLDTFSDRIIRVEERDPVADRMTSKLAFSFGHDGERIESLTDEVRALCDAFMETHPDVGVKVHNG